MLFQAATRAALNGRVLLLEGIENAERNVLPALNNLLENREMPLDDGRFIVAAARYDALPTPRDPLLLRCDPKFRVVVCGTPTPPFPGNPLDPPLRSRFQARVITELDTVTLIRTLGAEAQPLYFKPLKPQLQLPAAEFHVQATDVAQASHTMRALKPEVLQLVAWHEALRELREKATPGSHAIISAARLLSGFPWLEAADTLHRLLPWTTVPQLLSSAATGLLNAEVHDPGRLLTAELDPDHQGSVKLDFIGPYGESCTVSVDGGPEPKVPSGAELTTTQASALVRMVQSWSTGRAICVLGPSGEGKTFVSTRFARVLGHVTVEVMQLYEDMPARELLARRSIDAQGESIYHDTAITRAMRSGCVCVLDGLHRIPAGTTIALRQLLMDSEVCLPNGTSQTLCILRT